ncbi:MAG: hypothetical protein QXS38_00560 [Candidatus Pacearchaeota archaeon]
MAIETIASNVSTIVMTNELLARTAGMLTLFEAIGGLIIAYILFNIISLWLGRNKAKDISRMRETIERIDKRLAKFEKRRN